MFKGALLVVGLGLLAAMSMTFTPVPSPTEKNTYWVEGVVTSAGSPCCDDIVIRLQDDHHNYNINRGMEHLEEPEAFCEQLAGQPVRLRVIKHWSPLDPGGRIRSVATVELDRRAVFSTMQGEPSTP